MKCKNSVFSTSSVQILLPELCFRTKSAGTKWCKILVEQIRALVARSTGNGDARLILRQNGAVQNEVQKPLFLLQKIQVFGSEWCKQRCTLSCKKAHGLCTRMAQLCAKCRLRGESPLNFDPLRPLHCNPIILKCLCPAPGDRLRDFLGGKELSFHRLMGRTSFLR